MTVAVNSTGGRSKRRGVRRWTAGSLVAAAYSGFFVVGILQSDGTPVTKTVALVLLVAMVAMYVLMPVLVMFGGQARLPVRWAVLAGTAALAAPQWWLMGPANAAGLLIYPALLAAVLFPLRTMLPVVVVFAAVVLVSTWSAPGGPGWELALTLVALSCWMVAFVQKIQLAEELRRARDELARTAVATERERIARDLHDILGHSLTAITVKAGLAGQLLESDRAAAAAEIADVERLARSAVADVRATASGMREQSLAGALATGRAVLTAAGITPDLPGAVDDVTPAGRELFGYVVTEAITNVVRHSGATRCTVRLGVDWVEIVDDGRGTADGIGTPVADGSGLRGLTDRVGAAGGVLTAENRLPSGFMVRARLNGAVTAGSGGLR